MRYQPRTTGWILRIHKHSGRSPDLEADLGRLEVFVQPPLFFCLQE
jgi:hypothetical protein